MVSWPSCGGSSGASDGAIPSDVVFSKVVVVTFEGCVFGIPHIFDSVVLTYLSIDNRLLGSHIAALCSGVIVYDDVILLSPWPWAIPTLPNPVNVDVITAILIARIIIIIIGIIFKDASSFLSMNYWGGRRFGAYLKIT